MPSFNRTGLANSLALFCYLITFPQIVDNLWIQLHFSFYHFKPSLKVEISIYILRNYLLLSTRSIPSKKKSRILLPQLLYGLFFDKFRRLLTSLATKYDNICYGVTTDTVLTMNTTCHFTSSVKT